MKKKPGQKTWGHPRKPERKTPEKALELERKSPVKTSDSDRKFADCPVAPKEKISRDPLDLGRQREREQRSARRLLLGSAAVLLCMILTAGIRGSFAPHAIQTIRGNDPFLQAMIPKPAAEVVGTRRDQVLTEDKSFYNLDQGGQVTRFLLEVFPEDGMDLTDFERPELGEDLKLPAILREGNADGKSLLGGFGAAAVSKNADLEIKGEVKENRKYHNLKIRLYPSAGRYRGQTVLNLKKSYGKPCKVEEKFAFDLFADLEGMMSLRTQFVHLYVKNAAAPDPTYESYGLYLLVEQPDENYFLNRSLDATVNLYKARNFQFTRAEGILEVNDPNYSKKQFEQYLDIRMGDSHTALIELIDAVADDTQEIDDVVAKHLNRENLLNYLAMNVILGNQEGANQGFLLYKPATSAVWYFLPENMGETMTAALDPEKYQETNWGLSQFAGNLLYERFLQKPENLADLQRRIDELLAEIGTDTVTRLTNQYIPVLADFLTVNPDRGLLKYSPEKIVKGVSGYGQLMKQNVAVFREQLHRPELVVLERATETEEGMVCLHWKAQKSLLREPVSYRLEIAEDPLFQEILLKEEGIRETQYRIPKGLFPEDRDPGGIAYYRITAVTGSGLEAGTANHLTMEDGEVLYGLSEVLLY